MFGNFANKIKEAQDKMKEVKEKLEEIHADGQSEDGRVQVTVNGNRKLVSISIDSGLLSSDNKSATEAAILFASNQALDKAEVISETEMKSTLKGMLPGIPGLF